jgi:RNA polymerase sigma-70 factor (ECF subfamily)
MQVMTEKYHQNTTAIEIEKRWIEAAKADPAGFRPLYDKYYEPILKFIYRRLSSLDDAYDVTAQTFLQAMQKMADYEFRGLPFSSWLYKIALNELNTHFRKTGKFRAVVIETSGVENMLKEMHSGVNEEVLTNLMSKLPLLSSADFLLVEMRFFESKSFKEIADILEITENNAKVRTYRAIDKLRLALENEMK